MTNPTTTILCLARPGNSCLRACVCAKRFGCFATLAVAALFALANHPLCEGQTATEDQVKAAYLFNFLKFVEWPDIPAADAPGKWLIGIVGDSPVGDELARLGQGKNVMGRKLQVKKFQGTDNLRVCNILFISESQRRHLPALITSLRGSSVLTVGDTVDFISSGGMIQFEVEDARVRISIDVGATGRARLKVSSKLLSLARSVTETAGNKNN